MKNRLLTGFLALTISSPILAQTTEAQKLGATTGAERSTVFCLINCAQKSEVDKCVDAKVVQLCAGLFPDMKNPEKGDMKKKGQEYDSCGDYALRTVGGLIREQCLRAQAGKE